MFYETLSECGSKPAILSITLPYANDFQLKTFVPNFPLPLPQLYKEEYLQMICPKLIDTFCNTQIQVTNEMAKISGKNYKK